MYLLKTIGIHTNLTLGPGQYMCVCTANPSHGGPIAQFFVQSIKILNHKTEREAYIPASHGSQTKKYIF